MDSPKFSEHQQRINFDGKKSLHIGLAKAVGLVLPMRRLEKFVWFTVHPGRKFKNGKKVCPYIYVEHLVLGLRRQGNIDQRCS